MKQLTGYLAAGVVAAAALVGFANTSTVGATMQELREAHRSCNAMINVAKAAKDYSYSYTKLGPKDWGKGGGAFDAGKSRKNGWLIHSYGLYDDMRTKQVFEQYSGFIWGSRTVNFAPGKFCLSSGKTGKYGRELVLTFQKDGNLVIYNHAGVPQWASHTHGHGARLSFQNDRNIVIYDRHNRAVWAASWNQYIPRRNTKIATATYGHGDYTKTWFYNFAKAPVANDWYFYKGRNDKIQTFGLLKLSTTDRHLKVMNPTPAKSAFPAIGSATYGTLTVTNDLRDIDVDNWLNISASFNL